MSEKRGRPKKAVGREKNIGFYMTHDQYRAIQRKAELAKVNISDYMRQVAIQGEVRARWTEEERVMVKALIGMSADLHGLLVAAREQRVSVAMDMFETYRDIMDEIIKKLCHDR
jgi:hypothetical protein